MSNESSPVPPPPPAPPDEDTPQPRLRWLKRALLIGLGVILVVVGVFELWRQGTLKSERDALAATMEKVDDTILHGKTPAAYYNAHAKGKNGWSSYRAALRIMETRDERELDVRLRDMVDWHDARTKSGESAQVPDAGKLSAWLAASDDVRLAFEEAADSQVIAREYPPDGAWNQAAPAVMAEFSVWKIAATRVELLFAQGRNAQAERELIILLTLSRLRNQPGSLIEGLLTLSLGALATDLAVRSSSNQRISRESLAKLAGNWPVSAPLLSHMLEGELVWMCWLVQTEPTLSSADGWFAWFPRQQSDEFEERGPFVGIHMRRDIRKNMLHLQECLEVMLEGADLTTDLPPPHDLLGNFALDVRPQVKRVIEHDALFRMRKAAIELRLLELDGPLAKQREKAEAIASKLYGISMKFEGDDCVLSIVPAVFSGVEFESEDATIRLKPLP